MGGVVEIKVKRGMSEHNLFFYFGFSDQLHNSMTHSNDKYHEKSGDVMLGSDCHCQGA